MTAVTGYTGIAIPRVGAYPIAWYSFAQFYGKRRRRKRNKESDQ
jgi:hypothetical protein